MSTLITLPPIKNVSQDVMTGLQGRAPGVTTALLVRAGLGVLYQMSPEEMTKALSNQTAQDDKDFAQASEKLRGSGVSQAQPVKKAPARKAAKARKRKA